MNKINFLVPTLFAAVATIMLPGIAVAQAPSKPSAEQQAKIQALAQEYREITGKLGKIRDATYAANPDLVKQRDAFEKKVEKSMADGGYDADAQVQKMQDIAGQLKAKDLEESKKQELVQQFQQERQELLNAQREALAKPDVHEAGEKLQKDTLVAMKAQDKETEKLLDRLGDLRKNLQKISNDG